MRTTVLCLAFVLAAAVVGGQQPVVTNQQAVVARVGKAEIKRWELNMAARGLLMQLASQGRGIAPAAMPVFERDVLEEMIGRELFVQDAAAEKPPADLDTRVQAQFNDLKVKMGGEEKVDQVFRDSGISREEYLRRMRDGLLVQQRIDRLVAQSVTVTSNEVHEFFTANEAKFRRPETLRLSQILIRVPPGAGDDLKAAKRAQIEAARALVKDGNGFAEVAGKVSEDPVSAARGGDLGYFARGQLPAEFGLAVGGLKSSQVSDVVTTAAGYHVLQVTDRKAAEAVPFEKVQKDVEQLIRQKKALEFTRDYAKQLRAKTTVEVLLPPLPSAATSASPSSVSTQVVPPTQNPPVKTGVGDSGTAKPCKGSGTGFFVADGYLLTSAHVVRNSKDIRVNVGEVQYVGKVVKSDPANDVALVKLTSPQGGRVAKRVLPILNSGEVRLGDSVLTIGYPNPELQGIEPKLTRGEISSVAGIKDDVRFFQTSVAVQPGNSGGALVDVCGNVVGMVTMSLDEYNAYLKTGALPQNVNYALKSSFVLAFLDSVPELAGKLAPPKTEKGRPFEDLVKETQQATVIVLVY